MNTPMLDVRGLSIDYGQGLRPVRDLSFSLAAGGTLALVGESGSGKSQTALALMGLLPREARVSGSLMFEGDELRGLKESAWQRIRGARIGFVFQDPMTSLNPYLDIGTQMIEGLRQHRSATRNEALAEARRLLDAVRVPDAERRLTQFPHELSGGLRQRVMIAMSLMLRPPLLIADEPTTALDATVQAQVLRLLAELRHDFGMAVLLITHDLALVGDFCERTLVMYAGRAMEQGDTRTLLRRPTHPYTRALLRARPGFDSIPGTPLQTIPGQAPQPREVTVACAFAPRCDVAQPVCAGEPPPLRRLRSGSERLCHLQEPLG